ncbi:hypothetical protein V8F33_001358 [Rhypophila sp. PSN 637]
MSCSDQRRVCRDVCFNAVNHGLCHCSDHPFFIASSCINILLMSGFWIPFEHHQLVSFVLYIAMVMFTKFNRTF